MKVLDLQCAHHHSFEGWFGSEADFQSQLASGLVSCPMCGDTRVVKLLSAPRLNLSGATAAAEPTTGSDSPALPDGAGRSPATAKPAGLPATDMTGNRATELMGNPELQALFVRAVREIMRQTEDVGDQFADQARRMHHGQLASKAIRGQATQADTLELLEEGIDIMPLPHLPGLKETLQ